MQYLAVLSVSSHGSRRSVGGESTVATMYGAGDYFAMKALCLECRIEFSALFERECAPVAQWIRAADFGLSRPMRCGLSVGGGA